MTNQVYMREKKIFPLVVTMALPMMISMMVNSLYNIVDSFFVAKISEESMTALALVYPVQNLINSVCVGFGIGINATIAIHLGEGNIKEANEATTTGMILNTLHGVILMITGLLLMPEFFRLFTSDEKVIGLGLTYSNIVLLFTVPNIVAISFEKIFQAVGKMTVSMISMIGGCVVNIILDPILIFGVGIIPKMGIKGAAIATGIGQTVSLLIYLLIFILRPISVRIHLDDVSFKKSLLKKLYAIGIPATLNMALPSLLVSVLNSILAAFSQSYVLVLGAYYKLQTFLYLSANGVVQGMRPIVGYNYGAGEYKRVKKIFVTGLAIIASIMLVGTILCIVMPQRLIGMFTNNPETIVKGVNAIRIISMGFVVSAVSVTVSGTLEGLSKGTPSLIISILRYVVIMIPIAFILSNISGIGVSGVWHAFWITEMITAVVAGGIFYRIIKREF